VISRILVIVQYERKYGWTRIVTLYNFAVDDKIFTNSSRSPKVTYVHFDHKKLNFETQPAHFNKIRDSQSMCDAILHSAVEKCDSVRL
jgi:hypothetical protein